MAPGPVVPTAACRRSAVELRTAGAAEKGAPSGPSTCKRLLACCRGKARGGAPRAPRWPAQANVRTRPSARRRHRCGPSRGNACRWGR
eukprot:1807595-Lingulodinium_polyedra.AAC.1